jgi:hypothetical protein
VYGTLLISDPTCEDWPHGLSSTYNRAHAPHSYAAAVVLAGNPRAEELLNQVNAIVRVLLEG